MSLRATTEWLLYLVAIYAGVWSPAQCVTVHTPPKTPSTIEAQAKFFQYRHFPTHEDFDQGHRLGSERHFTERHERARPGEGLFSAKVRWGDKKGGYGEHYWDLNHAGHSNDQGNDGYDHDDGSYHEPNDPYGESRDDTPSYGNDEYDPEKSSYEETNRNKRAHPKVKVDRKTIESYDTAERPKLKRRDPLQAAATNTEPVEKDPPVVRYKDKRHRHAIQEDEPREKQQVVLVVNHKDDSTDERTDVRSQRQRHPEPTQSVPYESGAGVRQHADPAPAASVPRLFLEPSTGHVVDRATGQAYVLQPINKYN